MRHAGGSRLEIAAAESASGWTVAFRNDGAPPSGPIVEGNGLSSLRAQVETWQTQIAQALFRQRQLEEEF